VYYRRERLVRSRSVITRPNGGICHYQADGDLERIYYSSGDFQLEVGYDVYDRPTGMTWKTSANVLIASDEVVLSRSGRVVNQVVDGVDPSLNASSYFYDGAGRLVRAIPSTGVDITYGFGANPTAGCFGGAGKNSNRTTRQVAGQATVEFCFDGADRLLWSSYGDLSDCL
jgi:hypothetical protein